MVCGESIRCSIALPSFDREMTISLECRGRVVRVDPIDEDNYGVACRIEDYELIRRSSTSQHSKSASPGL
jgi:hypothetical protein